MIHFFDESFVIAVCFIIFIYFAYKPIKKAIVASLDAKIEEIKNKLTETENLKADAKKLLDEVKQEIETFEERKKSILQNAQNSTHRFVETKSKEMDLLLARKRDSAIKSIESEAAKASKAMQAEFMNDVLNLVKSYLEETKNNSVSDQEIIDHFTKK
ncbi:MAG: hypothetical protein Tsb006_7300 [Rickettsiaceae bacterium]